MQDYIPKLSLLECEEILSKEYTRHAAHEYTIHQSYQRHLPDHSLVNNHLPPGYPINEKNISIMKDALYYLQAANEKFTDDTFSDLEKYYFFSIPACIKTLKQFIDVANKNEYPFINHFPDIWCGITEFYNQDFMHSMIFYLDKLRKTQNTHKLDNIKKLQYVICPPAEFDNLFSKYNEFKPNEFELNEIDLHAMTGFGGLTVDWKRMQKMNTDRNFTLQDLALCIWYRSDAEFPLYKIQQILYDKQKEYYATCGVEADPIVPPIQYMELHNDKYESLQAYVDSIYGDEAINASFLEYIDQNPEPIDTQTNSIIQEDFQWVNNTEPPQLKPTATQQAILDYETKPVQPYQPPKKRGLFGLFER